MKVTFELSAEMLPLLPREVLEDCLKQVLNNSVPDLGHDSTSVCVPKSAASIPENYNHTEDQVQLTNSGELEAKPQPKPVIAKKPNKLFRNSNVISDDIINQCAEDYKMGISLANICRKYNLKYTTIYGRLNKLGLINRKQIKKK